MTDSMRRTLTIASLKLFVLARTKDEVQTMPNTWPGGERRAMTQSDHEAWNADNYPGTLQLCDDCGDETGRCEDDTIWSTDGERVLCYACSEKDTEADAKGPDA